MVCRLFDIRSDVAMIGSPLNGGVLGIAANGVMRSGTGNVPSLGLPRQAITLGPMYVNARIVIA
jgi:hypothetical protein